MIDKTVSIITMGCPKNMVDSEKLAGTLMSHGVSVVHESPDANIIVINTCGFINDAKSESIDEILAFSELKKNCKIEKIIVCGCLSQRYFEDLKKEMPEVDVFFGVNSNNDILKYILNLDIQCSDERLLSTPSHYAYLKIAEGCNRSCSYCAIPLIRGRQKSIDMESLVKEAEMLASKGVKELIVIAQDTTAYGVDIYGDRKLSILLNKLSKVSGIEWIRLMYTYPNGLTDDLINEIASNDKIVKYIDVPLQHINDEILQSMQRGCTKADIIELINKLRSKIPNVALRSSFIVGYPLEDRSKFLELYKFLSETKFERLGVFAYSPEEGTPAFPLGDPVKQSTKIKRMSDLLNLHEKNSTNINSALVGKTISVIIDDFEDEQYIGRLPYDAPDVDNVAMINAKKLTIGNIYKAKITSAGIFDVDVDVDV